MLVLIRIWFGVLLILSLFCLVPSANATFDEPGVDPSSQLLYVEGIRKRLGLLPAYESLRGIENVRIAILDRGFSGLETYPGCLPKSIKMVEDYSEFVESRGIEYSEKYRLGARRGEGGEIIVTPGMPFSASEHGRRMAQIVWAMAGGTERGPQFFLLNSNGTRNFKRAIRYAIDEVKPDIVLYSHNFEMLGNFVDGTGFAEEWVRAASEQGMIWINAAGNYGGRIWSQPVKIGSNGYVLFGEGAAARDFVEVKSLVDENPLVIHLTWNAFSQKDGIGTTKDLDLEFYDPNGKRLGEKGEGVIRQVISAQPGADNQGELAWESIGDGKKSLNVRASREGDRYKSYFIRVRRRGGDFSTDHDRLWLILDPQNAPIPDATRGGQLRNLVEFAQTPPVGVPYGIDRREILFPAGSLAVITVGDQSPFSARGVVHFYDAAGKVQYRSKPDVVLNVADAAFSSGARGSGSSNAAAYFAGMAVVLKGANPSLNKDSLLRFAASVVEISAGQAKKVAPRIVAKLLEGFTDELTRKQVRFYYLSKEDRLVAEVPAFTEPIQKLFPRFRFQEFEPNPEQYQFFLRESDGAGMTREVTAPTEPQAEYPWDHFRKPARDFVEVRVLFGGDNWRTPSLPELLAIEP